MFIIDTCHVQLNSGLWSVYLCVFGLIDTNVLFLLLCVVGSDSWSQ